MFKLALVQMHVRAGDKNENLARASALIDEAAAHSAQVVLLPEAMPLGWTDPSALTDADAVPDGHSCHILRDAARRNDVYVCSGVVERAADKIYNAAVLIDPSGRIILHHRKIHELDIGHCYYSTGDRLGVVQTPLATFGLMICADGFAHGHVLSRSLGYMGADVILSPSSWAVPADHDNARDPYGKLWRDSYAPVAKDFRLWIAGVSNVGVIPDGPWKDRKCIGCSLVVGPNGQTMLQGPYGSEAQSILYLDISPVTRPAVGCDWDKVWK